MSWIRLEGSILNTNTVLPGFGDLRVEYLGPISDRNGGNHSDPDRPATDLRPKENIVERSFVSTASNTQRKLQALEQAVARLLGEKRRLRGRKYQERLQMVQSATSAKESPTCVRKLHNLFTEYSSQGLDIILDVIENRSNIDGPDHPYVASMLHALSLVFRDQRNYEEAANSLNEALAIREKTLGKDHPIVAETLNKITLLYGKCGKWKDAEAQCKRALEIRETLFGKNHPNVARQLNNLAEIYRKQENFEESESCNRRALKIYEKNFGSYDPKVIKTRRNLVRAQEEARMLYRQIMTWEEDFF